MHHQVKHKAPAQVVKLGDKEMTTLFAKTKSDAINYIKSQNLFPLYDKFAYTGCDCGEAAFVDGIGDNEETEIRIIICEDCYENAPYHDRI